MEDLRGSRTLLDVPLMKEQGDQKSLSCAAAKDWNMLPAFIREFEIPFSVFRSRVGKEFFFDLDRNEHICSIYSFIFFHLKKSFFFRANSH